MVVNIGEMMIVLALINDDYDGGDSIILMMNADDCNASKGDYDADKDDDGGILYN